ncbi:hypothetical protein L1999_20150 [Neobacillus drentensis]|uniref:hypothetical protein n=1 Tax=Neobacillus drentensis TaxID=220684 RepID=UPI001F3923E3|nr:hypothetical protein [Neobacillus drentensis]ULT55396.1 hypothetical protein L1999_20150 [Neobacillus drentensis]
MGLKLPRGPEERVDLLENGQVKWTEDTGKLIIGGPDGNNEMANQKAVDSLNIEIDNARGGLPSLQDRLDAVDLSLADKASQTDLNTTNINVTQISNRMNGHFINVLYPPAPLAALNGNGQPENMANVQAIFDSIKNTGGIIFFPGNKRYVFTSTITLYDGITVLGVGKNPTNGYPTILDFKAITGTDSCFYMNGASDITLKDFYMYGTTTGSGNDIQMVGYCRRINIENIILNTKTTGYGIGVVSSLITSFWKNVLVTGAGTGFFIGTASTSVSLYNCYANYCTQYGYNIEGTYCSLHSCASDYNNLYGYVLQNANQVGLYSCGAESNVREGILILNATGIDVMSFRSHANNTGASTFYPSFMDIQNSNKILLSNCQDSSPNASTTYSLTSTTTNSGSSIVILNPNFGKAIHSRLLNVPRIDGSVYPGVIDGANVGNNSLFIDSADNALKFKNSAGVVKTITVT